MVIFYEKNFGGNTPSNPPDIRTVAVQVPCSPAADNGLYIVPVSTTSTQQINRIVSTSIRL